MEQQESPQIPSGVFSVNDNTAFDVFVVGKTGEARRGFVAIEVKYSETMAELLAALRPRFGELSNRIGVYTTPDSPALRNSPLP